MAASGRKPAAGHAVHVWECEIAGGVAGVDAARWAKPGSGEHRAEGLTPRQYVESEEGTYNITNGHFLCTEDFINKEIALGRRLVGPDGGTWTAP